MVVCLNRILKDEPLLAAAGLMACLSVAAVGQAAPAQKSPPTPVVVELFTSEGCSSCPPADELLQKMDALQPIPGAQLIVLSEHVDYWDHDGWKDKYSSAELTDRQKVYVSELGLNTPYTPQFIVDGSSELHATDPKQVQSVFEKALANTKIPVSLESVTFTGPQEKAVVRGHLEIDGGAENHNADVYVAVALNHAESQVLRGENQGHTLTHVAVVEQLVKVGKVEKKHSFSQDFQVKLNPGTNPNDVRIVAFVQEPNSGKITGATSSVRIPPGSGISSR
jgi:hypothetical protein